MYSRLARTVLIIIALVSGPQGLPASGEQQPATNKSDLSDVEQRKIIRLRVADQAVEAARGLEAQNNLEAASEMLQGVVFAYQIELGDSPKLLAAIGNLGRVLGKQHKPDDARIAFARALRILLDHPELADSNAAVALEDIASGLKDLSESVLATDVLAYSAEIRKRSDHSSEPSAEPALSDRLKEFARNTVVKRGPQIAIDAVYEKVDSSTPETRRVVCDGKGRIREELSYYRDQSDSDVSPSKPGERTAQETVLIVDFTKGTVITAIGKSDALLTNIVSVPLVHDKQSAAALQAKTVGEKDIMGHRCTGYQMQDPEMKMVVWVDNDVDFWVQRDITYPSGKQSVIRLKQWKVGPPDPKEFSLPASYKVTAMPAVIPNCPY